MELAPDRNLRRFRQLRVGTRRRLLQLLSAAGIRAEIVDAVRPNPFRIMLSLVKGDVVAAMSVLQNAALPVKEMRLLTDLVSITLVSDEIAVKHELDVLPALAQRRIPLAALSWHRQRLTILVSHLHSSEAVNILHDNFIGVRLTA